MKHSPHTAYPQLSPEEFDRFFNVNWLLSKDTSAATARPFPLSIFYTWWLDLQLKRIDEAVRLLQQSDYTETQYRSVLPSTSAIRTLLHFMLLAWPDFRYYEREGLESVYKNLFHFFIQYLHTIHTEDPYVSRKNVIHSEAEIARMLSDHSFATPSSPAEAKNISALILGAGTMVHGLFNDVVTDMGWDGYGPYSVRFANQEQEFVQRVFPDLRPTALNWPADLYPSVDTLIIYALYDPSVQWEFHVLGCHTFLAGGNVVAGLRHYSVVVDGTALSQADIVALKTELMEKSQRIYQHIYATPYEDQKKQALRQECYRFKTLFDAVDMNWEPTTAMEERVANKTITKEEYGYVDQPSVDKAYFRKVLRVDEIRDIVTSV